MPDGLIDAGNPPSHVDIELGDVLLVCGVTEELFLHGVQLLLREDHGERAELDGQALPNAMPSPSQVTLYYYYDY